MPAGVKIRRARPTDKRAVRAMLARIWSDDYVLGVFDEWTRDRRGGLWVAVKDGTVVGIAKLTLLGDREAWLHALRVDPRHQGQGIATALLEHRLSRARRLGARVARLDTAEDNVAVHRLMRRFGFARIGRFTLWSARARSGDPPRRATRDDVPRVMRLLSRGDGLLHEPYVERRLTRADVARAVRAGNCVTSDGAAAIVAQWRRHGLPRQRLAIHAIGGPPSKVGALLAALRAEAKVRGLKQVAFAAPSPLWRAARAAGYRRPWRDAMHVFEGRL